MDPDDLSRLLSALLGQNNVSRVARFSVYATDCSTSFG